VINVSHLDSQITGQGYSGSGIRQVWLAIMMEVKGGSYREMRWRYSSRRRHLSLLTKRGGRGEHNGVSLCSTDCEN
jgi:hypothetical protein